MTDDDLQVLVDMNRDYRTALESLTNAVTAFLEDDSDENWQKLSEANEAALKVIPQTP